MTLPAMCPHHAGVYATRGKALEAHPVHRPDGGRKALRREAEGIARQCPACPDPPERR